jgi:hypothetical protein
MWLAGAFNRPGKEPAKPEPAAKLEPSAKPEPAAKHGPLEKKESPSPGPVAARPAAPVEPKPNSPSIAKRTEPPPSQPSVLAPAPSTSQVIPEQTPPQPSPEQRASRLDTPAITIVVPPPKNNETAIVAPQPNPEEADWERIRSSGDVAALDAFLKRYPSGRFVSQARRRAELIEWNTVQDSEGLAPLRAFAAKYPEGEFAAKASARAREIEARSAAQQEIRQLLRRFAAAYQRKSLNEIREMWPSLGRDSAKAFADSFAQSDRIEFQLTPTADPVLDEPLSGSSYASPAFMGAAKVVCLRKVRTVGRRGERPPATDDKVTIRVRRADGKWTLVSFSVD